MKMVVTIAMILLGLSVGARAAIPTIPAHAQGTVPTGVWTGAYTIGEQRAFVRVDFEASVAGREVSYPEVVRLVRADLVDIDVSESRVRFGLPDGANTLQFDGALHGDVMSGAVVGADGPGSFVLQPEITLALADYVPLLGRSPAAPCQVRQQRLETVRHGQSASS